ncbi:hypothetical protein [Paenibacillus tarimensis]|uniref:hypothetical protein n=1 Tax=Paenibacillus tarimensis TaxID=416012 RepID=UPI001F39A6AF|nr:hypothetical protein [Paenibacillus tarimensis]MCF2943170.1 hypothetical protein [Paenibacillus tarimensis]
MNLRLFFLILAFSMVFFFSYEQEVNALSCAYSDDPQAALVRAGGAVYGDVKQIKTDSKYEGFTGTEEKVRYILVEVEQSWLTEVDSQIIAATDYTWGYEFKKGNNYLIYISEVDGELVSSPCSPTIEMSSSEQAVEWFGEGLRPKQLVNLEHKMWFMFELDIDMYMIVAAVLLIIIIVRFMRARNRRQGRV